MIIISDYDSVIKVLNDSSIKAYKPYNISNNIIYKIVKKVVFTFLNVFEFIFYNDKIFKNENPCTIIVFDGSITEKFLIKISKKYKYSRLIFWYWNPVRSSIRLSKIPCKFEKWTYSKEDAIKYGLKLNSQFYILDQSRVEINEPNGLICYFGKDKGRLKKLIQLENDFKKYGHNTYFHITSNSGFSLSKKYKKNIDYNTVVNVSANSRAIVDYYLNDKDGYSLRTIESILLNKKLITNNVNIINEPFYNSNNIFLIRNDNIYEVNDFLNREFISYSKDVIKYFSIEDWLLRFGEIK